MGVFTDSIVVELFPGTKLPYRIYKEFEFHSGQPDSGFFVKCEEGFRFNGTSIPWGLRWLIDPSDPDLLQCAAGHDKIFRTGTMIMRMGSYAKDVPVRREVANALMAEMMIARNVVNWKQKLVNTGLAIGSKRAWRNAALNRGAGAVRTATTF